MKMATSNRKLLPIQVYVRIRPKNHQDGASIIKSCVSPNLYLKPNRCFTLDGVFDDLTSQLSVYKTVVARNIKNLVKGYNCSIFAYGQTGTGKTYTIQGGEQNFSIVETLNWKEESDAGIIPRAAVQLYEELDKLDINVQRSVTVSFLEINNEEIRDLLSENQNIALSIYEDKSKGVHVKNLKEKVVLNPKEIMTLLKIGCERRISTTTKSHSIFMISVNIMETVLGNITNIISGKLQLIDLGGNENSSRNKEASNQSLLVFNRVIKALNENSSYIPYRDSKLTRILRDSLGGKTKTSIIATISPGMASLDDTVNTLENVLYARNVKNCPTINLKTSEMASEVITEIEMLKRDLTATSSQDGIHMEKDDYDEMTQCLVKSKNELLDKYATIRKLSDQIDNLSAEKEVWDDLKASFEFTKKAYDQCRMEVQEANNKIEGDEILINHYENEVTRCQDYSKFLAQRQNYLHDKVDSLYEESKSILMTINVALEMMEESVSRLLNVENVNVEDVKNNVTDLTSLLDIFSNLVTSVKTDTDDRVEQIQIVQSLVKNDDINSSNCEPSFESVVQYKQVLSNTETYYREQLNSIRSLVAKVNTQVADSLEILENFNNKTEELAAGNESDTQNIFETTEDINQMFMQKIETRLSDFKTQFLEEMNTNIKNMENFVALEQQNLLKLQQTTTNFGFKEEIVEYEKLLETVELKMEVVTRRHNSIQNKWIEIHDYFKQMFIELEEKAKNCHSLDLKQKLQDAQEKYYAHIKCFMDNYIEDDNVISHHLDEVKKLIDEEGAEILKNLEKTVETTNQSIHVSGETLKNELGQVINNMLNPINQTGNTPQRMRHNISSTVNRNRQSLLRSILEKNMELGEHNSSTSSSP